MENFNVAYCGLYCSECGKFKKEKCSGCYTNEKASWCDIRKCCMENNYSSCADCTIMPLKDCKKYNNFFSKVIGFATCTDRSKCIERIKEVGTEEFAKEMTNKKAMSFKKK